MLLQPGPNLLGMVVLVLKGLPEVPRHWVGAHRRGEGAGMSEPGQKFDQGKTPLALLDPYAVDQLGKVLAFGANKYGEHNWRGGLGWARLASAALRHIFAFLSGEDNDQESGLPHVAHAMCCLMFILGLRDKEHDDRWKGDA